MGDSDDDSDDFADEPEEEEAPAPKPKAEVKREGESKEFNDICDQGMAHVQQEEWPDATACFKRALDIDSKAERKEDVSEERADCAFNLACCHAQTGRLDDAERWLRRACAWGVRNVDIMRDEHLAPLRDRDYALFVNLDAATRPAVPRAPAVLQRSKRQRAGGAMARLIRAEKERRDAEDSEDVDEFWRTEKEDGDFTGESGSENDFRDVYDSDFGETESESEPGEDELPGTKEQQRKARVEKRKREKAEAAAEREKAERHGGAKRVRREAAEAADVRTKRELEGFDDPGDDEKDDDFRDAGADKEIAAAGGAHALAAAYRPAPTARDAVRAAKRDKLVAAAADELGLGGESDADDEMELSPKPEEKKKKKKKKKKKEKKKDAASVLAGLFGSKAAGSIVRRADRATEERKHAPPAPNRFEGIVKRQTVTEKKMFGGQEVEVKRSVRETDGQNAKRQFKDRLDAVLDAISGPKKVTAVAKSAAEWDTYKEKEGLTDSLKDAGKTGVLDKQAFLERADHRKFELERDQRNRERAKRDGPK